MKKVNGGWSLRGYKGKGGGSARQPVEAPDSLHSTSYARVLDLVSEGPIEGLVNGLQSVYLDQTPLQNADGSFNFQGVQFDIRHGTQQQEHIAGFPASEATTPVGVELVFGTPWVRSVTRPELSAVRVMLGVNGLSKADTSNGDINGYSVAYAIDLQTDGGAWVEVLSTAFTGKTSQSYRRTHRIDLPQGATNWAVRVRRLTPQANSSTIADTTVIDSITEVIDGKLRYPMSALCGVQVDASQFQSIPTRAYHMRGRQIRVPVNYDPVTGTYTGVWDGTFKTQYSNNPAWVFYDIVTNDRYGLGANIPQGWVNKWALYQIGSYCDEQVPTGRGNATERRFTCNVYLQSRGDAHRVLQDMVSVFRGMVYWGNGSAEPVADMPRDPVYTYTQANTIDGRFTYTGSRRKDRPTVALVSYNDMTDFGRQKVVYWQDDEAVQRYGVRKTEISAFGCTSESQALRVAKWALLTAKRETRNVNFSVALDGTLVAPGSVIRVADNLLAGKRIGGRIVSATTSEITLDSDLKAYAGDMLTVIMPNGVAETREVLVSGAEMLTADTTQWTADTTDLTADRESIPGASVTVTVRPPFSQVPPPESVWALESERLATQLFTVVSVSEGDGMTFDIVAVQHEPGKFAAIDYGTKLDDRPITVVPPRVQLAPTDVTISSTEVLWQGVTSTTVFIDWVAPQDAVAYDVEWRRDDSDWVTAGRLQTTRLEINNAYTGTYVARVRAINAIEAPSIWAQSQPTYVDGLMAAPPAVVGLSTKSLVFAIQIDWGFPDGLYVAERTELWYSQANDRDTAIKLGDFAYPQNTHTMMGLAAGAAFYFWARIVDKNGLPGPWTASVYGQASSDATAILQYLTDKITSTQLAQELLDEIESGGGAAVEVQEIKNELAAMYTIKTQMTSGGRTYIAGIGVGVENNEGIIESQVLVAADRFAVIHPNGTGVVVPFVVQGGQVFISSAFIANASIGSAKIADWLESDAVNSLGQKVWRLNMRTGEMQFNGAAGTSGRMTINNNVLRVYDGAGTLRVRLGIW